MKFEDMSPEQRAEVLAHLDSMWQQLAQMRQTLDELEEINARRADRERVPQ